MFTDERRQEILKLLEKDGRLFAKDLAEKFEMSIDSIRRDLSIMEEKGLLKRTHGGAIPATNVRNQAEPPSIRYNGGSEEQKAIAEIAVSYIKVNQTIFIGGAAIHIVMLKYLPTNIQFTVLTNSVEVAYHLRGYENIDTFLIGGQVKRSGNITDALATEFAKHFTIDLCFATAGAISLKGLSTATPEVSLFHKTVYDNSKRRVALVEHFKVGTDMFSQMYPINKLDLIITDEETTSENLELFKAQGIEIIIAKRKKGSV